MRIKNALDLSDLFMKLNIEAGDTVVDATAGNGEDTVYLASLVGETGKVYAFDIQSAAIENTKKRLADENLHNVVLINDGHENIDQYVKEKIKCAVFNLGYLPKGDKQIVTKPETTVAAIAKCIGLLDEHGIILVCAYTGHPGGRDEYVKIYEYFKKINNTHYDVLLNAFINQPNHPAKLFLLQKKFF